jgi:hypothetical protein
MKTASRILAFILLLFLGFGGIYGAFILISDPSGSKFDWSLDLLNGTPFSSYLLPGIVLLIANGIFPLCVAVSILLKKNMPTDSSCFRVWWFLYGSLPNCCLIPNFSSR